MKQAARIPRPLSEARAVLIAHQFQTDLKSERQKILAQMLADWSGHEMQERCFLEGDETKKKLKSQSQFIGQLISTASKLVAELEKLPKEAMGELGLRLEGWPMQPMVSIKHNPEKVVQDLKRSLRLLAQACPDIVASRQLRVNRMIILELQAIYEVIWRRRATRRVGNEHSGAQGREIGKFYEFVRAVWLQIYGSEYGLDSAIRNWSDDPDRYVRGTARAIIATMRARREWDGDFKSIKGNVLPI